MNKDLQNKIYLALFGVSGPVAKGLSLWFGFDGPTVEIILNICMIITPGIAGWIMAQMSTIANKMAHIQAMSASDQAKIASALNDTTLVKETAARPDIKAVVVDDRTNNPALLQAATDPNEPAILPASQVEVR